MEKKEQRQEMIRINRYLAMCGACSRREADQLIGAGRVTLDGRAAEAGDRVAPGADVRLDGRKLQPQSREIVLAVNKPPGVICTSKRHGNERLIGDLVTTGDGGRLFYMGRLDKDSEGLLLMTNLGELSDSIMRSRGGHEKEYVVQVDRPVTESFLRKMEAGVYLEELGVTTKPCRLWRAGIHGDRSFHIVLTQGLNRQIRRMCAALGYRVVSLKRIRIMHIQLGDLGSGESRELTEQEMRELKARAAVNATSRQKTDRPPAACGKKARQRGAAAENRWRRA